MSDDEEGSGQGCLLLIGIASLCLGIGFYNGWGAGAMTFGSALIALVISAS